MSDVPQESILDPLLFLIFFDTIADCVRHWSIIIILENCKSCSNPQEREHNGSCQLSTHLCTSGTEGSKGSTQTINGLS